MDEALVENPSNRHFNRELDRQRKHLAQADRLIVEIKRRIARQRLIVHAATEKGRSSIEAESLLRALNESRRALERHRQLILESLANGGSANSDFALS